MIDVRSVVQARDALLSDGVVPERLLPKVRPAIIDSWRRSTAAGAAFGIPQWHSDDRWSMRHSLRRAADPVLTQLAERLADLDTGVLLADQDAVILRRWVPDGSILPMLDRVNSDVGYGAAEDSVGTNGVGTVAETGVAMQVTGPEHLSTALTRFTCVGAPIHHPISGQLKGVITLSCLSDARNPLLTPLLTSTAREIEHRILEQASTRERLLLDAYLKAVRSRRGPVAVVGSDLFLAGPQVTALLRDIDQAQLWEHVRSVATGSRIRTTDLGSTAAQPAIATCRPIEFDGQVLGMIVAFDDRPNRTVPRRAPATRVAPSKSGPGPLPGRSPVLTGVVTLAEQHVSAGTPLLIEGEPGVGKRTLALALAGRPGSDVVTLDLAQHSASDPDAVGEAARAALAERPGVLVVLHLERVAADAVATFVRAFEDAAVPDLLITTRTISAADAGAGADQRLLDLLAAGSVVLPPLRHRPEDINEAVIASLASHSADRRRTIAPSALRMLMRAPWPGNLRELDAVVRTLVAKAEQLEIGPDDLPAHVRRHASRRTLTPIEELELRAILDALQSNHGNKYAAATAIGISRSTLYRKLRAYHVDPDHMYF